MKALLVLLLLAVATCNTEIQEIEEPTLEIAFDVNGLIKCLTEVAPLVPEVIEIINYIKAADWAQVATKALDAIAKLVPAAKGCIAAFKKEVNLEVKDVINYKYVLCMGHCKYLQRPEKTQCIEDCQVLKFNKLLKRK